MVNFSAQRISERVVAHIHHEIQVITADRFLQNSFCLAGAEAGSLGADEVGIPLITFKSYFFPDGPGLFAILRCSH